ncbi:hypothetical protein CI109_103720 [Kwoniella shandongensis]|uniref:Uncharacterized protein n=1 Tax=Kwoniella shandongensis TaxID=1734106 RepID=A0A5M6CB60_9TREE|nr:uncharacterized protein CI109_000584 [Kwoniella shandongensis]KAA5531012.1 hypothetical protein CI109_000584 [Kwoniella shandongensis]
MACFEQLPLEILEMIIFSVYQPYDHLSLSKTTTKLCKLYTSDMYQRLCLKFGFGRPLVKRKHSWREVFEWVIKHAQKCDVKACTMYGVAHPSQCWGSSHPRPELGVFPKAEEARYPHRHLATLGNVGLELFAQGNFDTVPNIFAPKDNWDDFWPDRYQGSDWNSDEVYDRIDQHPLFSAAFCCNSTTSEIWFHLAFMDWPRPHQPLEVRIYNPDGVTVLDVVTRLDAWLFNPMSDEMRERAADQIDDYVGEHRDLLTVDGLGSPLGLYETWVYFFAKDGHPNILEGFSTYWRRPDTVGLEVRLVGVETKTIGDEMFAGSEDLSDGGSSP